MREVGMGSEVKRLRGRKLQERNKRLAEAQPLCVMCLEEGRITPGEESDHIVALVNGGVDDETNLRRLCKRHHEQKTREDLGQKPEIGLDGWPVK